MLIAVAGIMLALQAQLRFNAGFNLILPLFAATILGGITFLGVQVVEYVELVHHKMLPWEDNFCATFYALTCYHGAHVLTGVIYLICILVGCLKGRYLKDDSSPIEIVGLFWHFVDLVWILLFTFVYLLEPIDVPGA